jgi:hypothetical protein
MALLTASETDPFVRRRQTVRLARHHHQRRIRRQANHGREGTDCMECIFAVVVWLLVSWFVLLLFSLVVRVIIIILTH